MWIFGYGSIIWRPDFPYIESRTALLRDWRRRLWQGSPDHRGTPSAPGRVVTIVRDPGAECFGVAFRVASPDATEILRVLDDRESGGYVRCDVELEFDNQKTDAITYFAPETNANFLGPGPFAEMEKQVRSSVGNSGKNSDYVIQLAAALESLEICDDDIMQLAQALSVD